METDNSIKCPNCFSVVAPEDENCPYCKAEFYNCSNCNALVLQTDTVCKNCNSNLNQEEIHKPVETVLNMKPQYEYKSLDGLTKVLVILMSSVIFFSIIVIYTNANDIAYLNENNGYEDTLYYEENYFYNLAIIISSIVFIPIYLATSVIFLIWIRQAYRNLLTLQRKPNEFSSGWAIGSYFVPFLNYVRPYTIMKEIWFRSQPDYNLPDEDNNQFYKRLSSNTVLILWWTFFLIERHLSYFSFKLSLTADTVQKLLTASWFDLIATSIGIFVTLILLYLITTINDWQSEKIKSKPKGYCQHCGNLVELDALLCTHCGKELIQSV
ncbi:MAG: DUF4328 domain-containing protein [Ignavibacteriaceae bacterium]|nr:DUF4328 domain-containing protein [Ignavibacteriaceae bacterium]